MLHEIPGVLSVQEIARLRDGLARLPFEDGRRSAGEQARGVKRNMEAHPARGSWEACARIVMDALMRNRPFLCATLPRKVMNPLFNRYEAGMEYGSHTDVSIMDMGRGEHATRTDISFTLFLSDPATYEGGDLVIEGTTGESRFRCDAGTAVVYPSGSLHRVEAVRSGVRLAAVGWVQSYVKSPEHRYVICEVEKAMGMLEAHDPSARELNDQLLSIYHQLLRMWSET